MNNQLRGSNDYKELWSLRVQREFMQSEPMEPLPRRVTWWQRLAFSAAAWIADQAQRRRKLAHY